MTTADKLTHEDHYRFKQTEEGRAAWAEQRRLGEIAAKLGRRTAAGKAADAAWKESIRAVGAACRAFRDANKGA